jgi:hypothetical protein
MVTIFILCSLSKLIYIMSLHAGALRAGSFQRTRATEQLTFTESTRLKQVL